jgi:hypothetical protein
VLTLKCWGDRSKSLVPRYLSAPPEVRKRGIGSVSRALRNQGLWLTLTYVGLILLMARAYA